MVAPARLRILYFVGVGLLLTFDLLACVDSQGLADVWFSLSGTTYQNNSIVTLENIGDNSDNALLCETNLTACCKPPFSKTALGNWFFPNGTRVPSKMDNVNGTFSRTRKKMGVRMHHRRGGEDGIYRCEIPDSTNITQTIYIGVYNTSTGSPNVTGLTFHDQSRTLTCNSTGGPATTVTWRRDGVVITLNDTHQQTKRLVDDVNGTYQTVLTIDPSVGWSDIVGTYNCTVENVRGESSKTVVVPPASKLDPSQTVRVTSPPQTDGAITTTGTVLVSSSIQPTNNPPSDGAIITTVPVSSNTQPTNNPPSDGAIITTGTAPVSSNTQPTSNPPSDGAIITTVPVSSNTQPTNNPPSDGAIITTVPVSSNTQPTNNPPSDGATTTTVIIVVAVVIILVVIVVGVVMLVVLIRAKKRKQQLVINKLQSVTTENEDIEMKLKHKETSNIEASSSADQPPHAEIQSEVPPRVPSKSEEHLEYFNQNNTEYSEIKLEQADSKHALPIKPPRQVKLLNSLSEEMEPVYQNMDQHCDPPTTTNILQENNVYTVPDTTNSHIAEMQSIICETVYSEPTQPSLFTDAVETLSDCEDLHPYAPIYTIPINLPSSKEVLLKVFGSNIREIRELGMGVFGKVILAETVGLSAKDLRLNESEDDKSKSTLVAVKKLKSDAPNATKEAFEKEVNFMSRLTHRNVIRILGVCYEDTPFIMMEYMEKGDLNQYLQKFKIHTTESEPQGQITTSTLVHIATQITNAMKYLASHNFVHRDLATRNCLVGPNYLVKISDFGMSRSLYDSHYYRIHGRAVLPVRWMAFECFYGKFSQKSDVWAFGVTVWEIFALAKEQPYNDMSDKQVVENALKGKNLKILAKPDMCPLEVYKIMLECWAHNSERRATFEKLFQLLTSIQIDW